jgi:hypothetical protein
MNKEHRHLQPAGSISVLLFGIFLLSACQGSLWGTSLSPTPILPIMLETFTAEETIIDNAPASQVTVTSQITEDATLLWAGPAIPQLLRDLFTEQGFQLALDRASTDFFLDLQQDAAPPDFTWTFALVAPFPTLMDDITSQDLHSAWSVSSPGPFGGIPLLMDESTLKTFSALWGEPAPGAVQIVSADQVLHTAWNQMPAWAIIPFEAIEPKWKVLMIDGQSPIQKGFDPSSYPLIANYQLTCSEPCPSTFSFDNRDPNKMTTVIMTGVTALVRATAATMERQGILHPGEFVREIFLEADILHINNEVPFYSDCPLPNPVQPDLRFCSSPRYMDLLLDIGADVVELSGDHFADYGIQAMYETIEIYKQNDLYYYGGGLNLEDGRKPLLLEVNGNKLMFIGCNRKAGFATATETIPGAVPCDFDYITTQIAEYRSQGYLPISTFQHYEYETADASPEQILDFRNLAEAGAVVVSGSQAHVPQVMEFHEDAFIHYGLGNLFFDQFNLEGTDIRQKGFITRHVFYDGRYLGAELITTFLIDYARPRLMTETERENFLREYFAQSGWNFPQAGP